jgi:hypothetical protein
MNLYFICIYHWHVSTAKSNRFNPSPPLTNITSKMGYTGITEITCPAFCKGGIGCVVNGGCEKIECKFFVPTDSQNMTDLPKLWPQVSPLTPELPCELILFYGHPTLPSIRSLDSSESLSQANRLRVRKSPALSLSSLRIPWVHRVNWEKELSKPTCMYIA